MRALRLKEAYPTAKAELWCEDEHRLGLIKPIIRKAWSPIGEGPLVVEVHQRQEWTYLYAFARPKTGEVGLLVDPPHRERGGLLDGFGELRQGDGSGKEEAHP